MSNTPRNCPKCSRTFATSQALGGHVSKCKGSQTIQLSSLFQGSFKLSDILQKMLSIINYADFTICQVIGWSTTTYVGMLVYWAILRASPSLKVSGSIVGSRTVDQIFAISELQDSDLDPSSFSVLNGGLPFLGTSSWLAVADSTDKEGCYNRIGEKIKVIKDLNDNKLVLFNSWIAASPEINSEEFTNFVWMAAQPDADQHLDFDSNDAEIIKKILVPGYREVPQDKLRRLRTKINEYRNKDSAGFIQDAASQTISDTIKATYAGFYKMIGSEPPAVQTRFDLNEAKMTSFFINEFWLGYVTNLVCEKKDWFTIHDDQKLHIIGPEYSKLARSNMEAWQKKTGFLEEDQWTAKWNSIWSDSSIADLVKDDYRAMEDLSKEQKADVFCVLGPKGLTCKTTPVTDL